MTLDGRITDAMTVVAVERFALAPTRWTRPMAEATGRSLRLGRHRRRPRRDRLGCGLLAQPSLGAGVLGLERFALDHANGASADHSRIIRLSYHRPDYVRLAKRAYATWAEVEAEAGERVVTTTGGLDLWPANAAIPDRRLHRQPCRRGRARSSSSTAPRSVGAGPSGMSATR